MPPTTAIKATRPAPAEWTVRAVAEGARAPAGAWVVVAEEARRPVGARAGLEAPEAQVWEAQASGAAAPEEQVPEEQVPEEQVPEEHPGRGAMVCAMSCA